MKAVSSPDIPPDFQIDEDEINLREYFYILSSYKWAILGLTFVITLLSALYVYSLSPVFRATATVLIETEKENVVKIEQVYGMPNAYYEYYQTQLGIIRSRGLLEGLVDKLDLIKNSVFTPSAQEKETGFSWKNLVPDGWLPAEDPLPQPQDERSRRNAIVGAISGMLNVSLVTDSSLVRISFDSTNPQITAQLANGLADVYIEHGLESQLESTRKASDWINEQMQDLKKKVDESERALQAYLDREKLVDAKGVDSIAVKQLDDISKNLGDARRNSSEAGEIYRQMMALEGQPPEAYESIPEVMNHAAVNSAKNTQVEAEKKVMELEKRYGPKHPKMVEAKVSLDVANNNLKTQIKNIVNAYKDSVKQKYTVARAEETHLNDAYARTRQEIGDINRSGYELKTLENEVQSNRQLYDMFLTRLKETTATGNLHNPNARIVEYAMVPGAPYKPNKQRFIFIAFLAGLLASMSLVFMVEKLDNTLQDSNAVENKLFLPALSILPKLGLWDGLDRKRMRYFTDKKHSGFSENIRTIRTSVLLNNIDDPNKTVLITSSIPGEGKSMLAINLALAMGQMGKTLLIDCDMRKPVIGKVFGLQKHPGLTHFIAGTHQLQESIHYFEEDKIYIMPGGQLPSNPLELLSSNRFEKGLDALKKAFTYIVIDSAPTVPVSDPVVLSRLVNATIYMVKAHATPYQLARTGIKKLQQVNANIVGVVLNQVNPAKRPGRYGYGHYDYYTYYGYHK
jgi:capsular exopolysaccharide synthesis family protein